MARRASSPIDTQERIRVGADALGVQLGAEALDRLSQYVDELERWNERSNLVGEHDRRALIDRHVVDSLAAVPLLRRAGESLRIADAGSGAGLPGIPLALALTPREMVLIEPRRKRASFLRAVRRVLPDAALTVFEGHAEDLAAGDARGTFDAVVSRAALPDESLSKVASELLRADGLVIAYRGDSASQDASPAGVGAAGDDTLSAAQVERYRLGSADRTFSLVIRRRLQRFT
jgi:16S rRNA (guanine527-N7)-methyltransferase